jgi:hypothetical protein
MLDKKEKPSKCDPFEQYKVQHDAMLLQSMVKKLKLLVVEMLSTLKDQTLLI